MLGLTLVNTSMYYPLLTPVLSAVLSVYLINFSNNTVPCGPHPFLRSACEGKIKGNKSLSAGSSLAGFSRDVLMICQQQKPINLYAGFFSPEFGASERLSELKMGFEADLPNCLRGAQASNQRALCLLGPLCFFFRPHDGPVL